MEVLAYVGTAVLSSLGLCAGGVIGWLAKDELSVAYTYLRWLQAVLAGLLVGVIMYTLEGVYAGLIAVVVAILVSVVSLRLDMPILWYSLFGVLISLVSEGLLIRLIASLIFLYGLPTGSIAYKKQDFWKRMIIPGIVFVVIAVLLF
ncbi:MAG: hypothetical protein AABX52_02185 [Nanoarchaeota archaeon]